MKRLRLLLLVLVVAGFASTANAQLSTVTGDVLLPSGGSPSNTLVCFSLQNYKPTVPRVLGTSILVQPLNFCITPTSTGSFSTALYRNDFITPSNTRWLVEYKHRGIVTSAAPYVVNTASFNLNSATPDVSVPNAVLPQFFAQSFIFTQATAATTWAVVHGFNDPNVVATFFNAATPRQQIFPDTVALTDSNTLTATFTVAQAGIAIVVRAGQISLGVSLTDVVVKNPTANQTISSSNDLIVSGGVKTARLNNTFVVDGNTYSTVSAAVTAVGSNGGVVDVPDGYTETITSTLNIGSSTKPVHLRLGKNVKLTCNITDGVSWCIKVFNGSSISGAGLGEGPGSSGLGTSAIVQASTFNGAGIITNGQQDATQEYFVVERLFIRGNALSVTTRAMIELVGVYVPSWLRDLTVFMSPSTRGLWLRADAAVTPSNNVLYVTNCWFNGVNQAGTRPLVIDGAVGASDQVNINFFGGAFEHAGTGQFDIEINGNGDLVQNVNFFGTQVETHTTVAQTVVAIRIRDAKSVNFFGVNVNNTGGGNTQYAFEVSESAAGLTEAITLHGARVANSRVVNNLISGLASPTTQPYMPLWQFSTSSDPSRIDAKWFFEQTTGTGWKNRRDAALDIDVDSGLAAGQASSFRFLDQGILKWTFGKSSGNAMTLRDETNALARFSLFQGGGTTLNSAGTAAVQLNANNSSGTGGLEVWDGAATAAIAASTKIASGGAVSSLKVVTSSPATPSASFAAIYSRSTNKGLFFKDDDGFERTSFEFEPAVVAQLYEDFLGGLTTTGNIGSHGWRLTTSGAGSYAIISGTSGRPGQGRLTTDAAASASALSGPAGDQVFGPANQGNWRVVFSVKPAADITTVIHRDGLVDAIGTGDPANGIFFRSTNGGNWFAVTRAASVETTTDTAVAFTSAYKRFEIVMNSAGTSVNFRIDGTSVATHTANIPSVAVTPVMLVETTAAVARVQDVDYYMYKLTGLSR